MTEYRELKKRDYGNGYISIRPWVSGELGGHYALGYGGIVFPPEKTGAYRRKILDQELNKIGDSINNYADPDNLLYDIDERVAEYAERQRTSGVL